LSAGFNYLVIGAVGATFYVIGVGFVYAITGTLNIADLATRIADIGGGAALYAGFGFMIAGIMVKAAVFPVHIWLPAAYGYAPSAVSSLLAAIATKAALYVLARLLFTLFAGVPDITELAVTYVIVPLSLAGIFVGTVMAIYEKDIKLLLAHSSVAQIGYIALGFGLASSASVAASFVHIGNHALIKGGLFMAVGGFVAALGSRANLASFVGIGRLMPITSTAFTVCGLSLAGLPLTAGFISKLYLVRAILAEDAYVITALVLLSSALSLIYLWKIIEVMWMQSAPAKAPNLAENPAIYVPLWIVALTNIWFGVDASWLVAASRAAAAALLGGGL
jgi:multicomponent Na+:H+ antiporter subunit D